MPGFLVFVLFILVILFILVLGILVLVEVLVVFVGVVIEVVAGTNHDAGPVAGLGLGGAGDG